MARYFLVLSAGFLLAASLAYCERDHDDESQLRRHTQSREPARQEQIRESIEEGNETTMAELPKLIDQLNHANGELRDLNAPRARYYAE